MMHVYKSIQGQANNTGPGGKKQTWGQRLLELVCLVCVCDTECVEVAAAPDLELGHIPSLLDLH